MNYTFDLIANGGKMVVGTFPGTLEQALKKARQQSKAHKGKGYSLRCRETGSEWPL